MVAAVTLVALTAICMFSGQPGGGLAAQAPSRIAVARTMTAALDVFRTASQKYTLAHTPTSDGGVLVFVNGLLMLAGTDYTLNGTALTFTGQTIGDNPVIQVQYWVAN